MGIGADQVPALGDISGIPRILDAEQCNDCYSLAVIALKLKEAFGLDDIKPMGTAQEDIAAIMVGNHICVF